LVAHLARLHVTHVIAHARRCKGALPSFVHNPGSWTLQKQETTFVVAQGLVGFAHGKHLSGNRYFHPPGRKSAFGVAAVAVFAGGPTHFAHAAGLEVQVFQFALQTTASFGAHAGLSGSLTSLLATKSQRVSKTNRVGSCLLLSHGFGADLRPRGARSPCSQRVVSSHPSTQFS
jgi:hypothetical protein